MNIDMCASHAEALHYAGLDTVTLYSRDPTSTVAATLSSSVADAIVHNSRGAEKTAQSMPWGEVKVIILACCLKTAQKKIRAL